MALRAPISQDGRSALNIFTRVPVYNGNQGTTLSQGRYAVPRPTITNSGWQSPNSISNITLNIPVNIERTGIYELIPY
jgi:hypothetical protein